MKQRKNGLLISGILVIALALAWVLFKKQPAAQNDVTEPAQEQRRITARTAQHGPEPRAPRAPATQGEDPGKPPTDTTTPEEFEKILAILHKAEVTYDAKELKTIDPYLRHSNAAVRAAAIESMINLGDASAGKLLRAAAAKTTDSKEIIALLEAAEYVELPSATLKFKKKEE